MRRVQCDVRNGESREIFWKKFRPVDLKKPAASVPLGAELRLTRSPQRTCKRAGDVALRTDIHSKGGTSVSDANGHRATHDDRDHPGFDLDMTSVVEIPVQNGPISDIDISRDGSRLLVSNYGRDTVSVIDTDTRQVLNTLAGLNEPFAIAISGTQAHHAYVGTASTAYDSIEVIDIGTNTRIATHQLTLSVSDLVVSSDGKYLCASRNGARSADVVIVDTATGELEAIELAGASGTTTECVRLSSDGSRLYVGTNGPSGGQLVAVENRTRCDDRRIGGRSRIVGTVELGLPVRDVALSDDGAIAYVASCGPVVGAVLDVVDTAANKITDTRKIGEITGPLTRLALSGDGRRAYLVSEDRITVVGTATLDVVGDIRVAEHPSCVVESPDGRYLYVADYSGVVAVAPIAPPPRIDAAAQIGRSQLEWTVPESLHYEAALV